ncbi:uncharacterized protein LOC143282674 [Babylonia areolata]|uniref:uncharacterized protein LOC143282674 n=1 Tax=Babylonia areolata TaxID=304850 RepID=UPI003FD50E3A
MANVKVLNKDPFTYAEERRRFLEDLQRFHTSRGTPFDRIPRIGGREVDLYRLYRTVTDLGGWQKVNNDLLWEDVQEDFNVPMACTNGSQALKYIYFRYLNIYEKVHFLGLDPDSCADEQEEGPARKKICLPVESIPLTYNYSQHSVKDHQREAQNLSTDLARFSDYDKLEMSLRSGLPNEVDFAVNVCLLLSNEGRYVLKLNKSLHLLPLLMANVGLFEEGPGTLEHVMTDIWTKSESKRDFLRFWHDIVKDENVRESIKTKNGVYKRDEMVGSEVLHLGRDLGVRDAEGQRVLQLAMLIRNLSFEDVNQQLLACSSLVFRFLMLCVHSSYGSLRQLALDTLGNLAAQMVLQPVETTATQLILNLVKKSLVEQDKFVIVRALEMLSKLCQLERNETVLSESLEGETYSRIVQLLTVHDIQLIVHTLEALYQLSELGETTTTMIANVKQAVDMLVNLITVEAQSYGPNSLIGIKVVEYVPPADPNATPSSSFPPPSRTVIQSMAPGTAPGFPVPPSPHMSATDQARSDLETTAANWLQGTYETKKGSCTKQHDLFAEYQQFCCKFGIADTLTAADLVNIVKSAIPQAKISEVDKGEGPKETVLKGLSKRAKPKPFAILAGSDKVYKPSACSVPVNSSLRGPGPANWQLNSDPSVARPHTYTPTLRQRLMEPPQTPPLPHPLVHYAGTTGAGAPPSARPHGGKGQGSTPKAGGGAKKRALAAASPAQPSGPGPGPGGTSPHPADPASTPAHSTLMSSHQQLQVAGAPQTAASVLQPGGMGQQILIQSSSSPLMKTGTALPAALAHSSSGISTSLSVSAPLSTVSSASTTTSPGQQFPTIHQALQGDVPGPGKVSLGVGDQGNDTGFIKSLLAKKVCQNMVRQVNPSENPSSQESQSNSAVPFCTEQSPVLQSNCPQPPLDQHQTRLQVVSFPQQVKPQHPVDPPAMTSPHQNHHQHVRHAMSASQQQHVKELPSVQQQTVHPSVAQQQQLQLQQQAVYPALVHQQVQTPAHKPVAQHEQQQSAMVQQAAPASVTQQRLHHTTQQLPKVLPSAGVPSQQQLALSQSAHQQTKVTHLPHVQATVPEEAQNQPSGQYHHSAQQQQSGVPSQLVQQQQPGVAPHLAQPASLSSHLGLQKLPGVTSHLAQQSGMPSLLAQQPGMPSQLAQQPGIPSHLAQQQQPGVPSHLAQQQQPGISSQLAQQHQPGIPSQLAQQQQPGVPLQIGQQQKMVVSSQLVQQQQQQVTGQFPVAQQQQNGQSQNQMVQGSQTAQQQHTPDLNIQPQSLLKPHVLSASEQQLPHQIQSQGVQTTPMVQNRSQLMQAQPQVTQTLPSLSLSQVVQGQPEQNQCVSQEVQTQPLQNPSLPQEVQTPPQHNSSQVQPHGSQSQVVHPTQPVVHMQQQGHQMIVQQQGGQAPHLQQKMSGPQPTMQLSAQQVMLQGNPAQQVHLRSGQQQIIVQQQQQQQNHVVIQGQPGLQQILHQPVQQLHIQPIQGQRQPLRIQSQSSQSVVIQLPMYQLPQMTTTQMSGCATTLPTTLVQTTAGGLAQSTMMPYRTIIPHQPASVVAALTSHRAAMPGSVSSVTDHAEAKAARDCVVSGDSVGVAECQTVTVQSGGGGSHPSLCNTPSQTADSEGRTMTVGHSPSIPAAPTGHPQWSAGPPLCKGPHHPSSCSSSSTIVPHPAAVSSSLPSCLSSSHTLSHTQPVSALQPPLSITQAILSGQEVHRAGSNPIGLCAESHPHPVKDNGHTNGSSSVGVLTRKTCNGLGEVNGGLGSPDSVSNDLPPSPTEGVKSQDHVPNGLLEGNGNNSWKEGGQLSKEMLYNMAEKMGKMNGVVHHLENGDIKMNMNQTMDIDQDSQMSHAGEVERKEGEEMELDSHRKQGVWHVNGLNSLGSSSSKENHVAQSLPVTVQHSKPGGQVLVKQTSMEEVSLDSTDSRLVVNCGKAGEVGVRPLFSPNSSHDSDVSCDSFASSLADSVSSDKHSNQGGPPFFPRPSASSAPSPSPSSCSSTVFPEVPLVLAGTIPKSEAANKRSKKKAAPKPKAEKPPPKSKKRKGGKNEVPESPTPPVPARPLIMEYMCEWAGCGRCFDSARLVYIHATKTHVPAQPEVVCQWHGCEPLRRKRWSLVTHLQDHHCSEMAQRAGCQRRFQAAQTAAAASPQPPTPLQQAPALVYPPDAAMQAIKRFHIKPPFPEFADPREGPVTKHIRLTAALILRNLARYSALGRSLIKHRERQLSYVTMSTCESSTALSSCLWEILHDT